MVFPRSSHCCREPALPGIPAASSHNGISPVSSLAESLTVSRLSSRPKPSGISPVRPLPARSSFRRAVSWPHSGGIGPSSPLRLKSNSQTRAGEPPTATPSHSAMGRPVPQSRAEFRLRASIVARSTSQSLTRPRFLSGSGTTTPLKQESGSGCSASFNRSFNAVLEASPNLDAPELLRYAPGQLISIQFKRLQFSEVAQFRRYFAGQAVMGKPEMPQVGQLAEFRRHAAGQEIGSSAQLQQGGKTSEFRGISPVSRFRRNARQPG